MDPINSTDMWRSCHSGGFPMHPQRPRRRRLKAWVDSWSLSQRLFLLAVTAVFIAAMAYQAHVIQVLSSTSFVYQP